MKLLLHTCCAPCLIYPLEKLREKKFEVAGLFYNPNIHPFAEYQKRGEAVAAWSRNASLEVVFPEYLPQEFFRAVHGKETPPERCSICWYMRLKRTAEEARQGGFGYFSTTLLVSPYQSQERLRKIGDEVATEAGVSFHYEDFRPGFRASHDLAKAEGIYCQRYCGCLYSELERCKKSEKR